MIYVEIQSRPAPMTKPLPPIILWDEIKTPDPEEQIQLPQSSGALERTASPRPSAGSRLPDQPGLAPKAKGKPPA
jgi:hypothetical protein